MPAITADTVLDLVASTLEVLNKNKVTINATDLQDFVALPEIEKQGMIKEQSGTSIKLNYMYRNAGTARNTGLLFGTDTGGVIDMLTTGDVEWRATTNHYEFDVGEVAINRDPARILDLVKVRRTGCDYSTYEIMEDNFWGKPTSSTDTETPWGVGYWLPTATGTPTFNNCIPSGFTTSVGGIAPATYTRWRPWAGAYTAITKADLIRAIRKAMYKTSFKNPVNILPSAEKGSGEKVKIYTTYEVVRTMEEIAEGQNDNLGNDVASKDGAVTLRRIKVNAVPWLDANTSTNPVYGINWSTFGCATLSGQWAVENAPEKVPNQHRVVRVHKDYIYNFVCVDRRKNWVLAQ